MREKQGIKCEREAGHGVQGTSEFSQKSEMSGSDVFRRFQTISDRPDLQSADICRPRSDVCDLPV